MRKERVTRCWHIEALRGAKDVSSESSWAPRWAHDMVKMTINLSLTNWGSIKIAYLAKFSTVRILIWWHFQVSCWIYVRVMRGDPGLRGRSSAGRYLSSMIPWMSYFVPQQGLVLTIPPQGSTVWIRAFCRGCKCSQSPMGSSEERRT